ncbi:RluA family pseudouridine synthase [Bacillus sp. 31A1R]|uniref:Pseudouridine synthase n=1 Tax=Robertmurraya mangrovi TaxID=3098077 RepID=A0ABU5IT89_9BACI|nr:RluA family pseudouridine synthase [Bacillus sp. 31A1R]MDZ5470367.1 RluA family pseudouridine synthase [Bacillus sp. 31A1R]
MSRFRLRWDIDSRDEGSLIKEFLKEHEISKAALTDIKFKGGYISVNELEVNVRYPLKMGDKLEVIFPEEVPSEGVKGENIPLTILYEDEYLLIVVKPAGMSTIPSREHPTGSLANGLVGYYIKNQIQATSHIVTRLDRDTSGIVLIAKHRHVHHLFSKQQKSGRVNRTYEALVEGTFSEIEGRVVQPIGRKADSIIEREVRPDGQYASTRYKVLSQFPNHAHVELKLDTGRTHQIRVHMSYLGHPLLGDDLYGGSVELINRQALHCREISFYHPFLKKSFSFTAALPMDMQQLLLEDREDA